MEPHNQTDFSRFNQVFLDEAANLLQTLESGLLALESTDLDPDHLHSIFRAAHSIKGNAGMTGWETVAEFTHVIEGVLDELRSGRRQPEKNLTTTLLDAVDEIRRMLERPPTEPLSEDARRCLDQLLKPAHPLHADGSQTIPQQTEYLIDWTPPADCLARGVDPLRVLSTLNTFGVITRIECNTEALPDLCALEPNVSYLSWSIHLRTKETVDAISDVFTFQALDDQLSITERPTTPVVPKPNRPELDPTSQPYSHAQAETVRVAAVKLDAVFNLVGEMVITQSMATQAYEALHQANPRLESTLQELKRQTRELQDRIMSLRLVPVEQVFCRFPRLVHDLSQQLDKQIQLEISGTDTEIDRALVDQISDPLIHLIRNCADHGIETSDQRRREGKSPVGLIRLTARSQGGSAVVELQDDGRGIDAERIRAKALKLGLLQPHIKYSEKHIQSLIFQPGFSTADKVTAVSGRGVGMDAVRRSVESVSGSISIQSTLGKGSKFTIHVPMTLAILDGLLVSVAKSVLVLPLASILECKQTRNQDIQAIPSEQTNQLRHFLIWRNSPLPLLPLNSLLNQGSPPDIPSASMTSMTIVIEHNGHQLALLVDEILGQQQVVIKSLETNYRRIEGLQGATILGDGRVALVVDLAAITRIQSRQEECV